MLQTLSGRLPRGGERRKRMDGHGLRPGLGPSSRGAGPHGFGPKVMGTELDWSNGVSLGEASGKGQPLEIATSFGGERARGIGRGTGGGGRALGSRGVGVFVGWRPPAVILFPPSF
eukprot:4691424-Prymnesium_polylepis.1